MLPKALPSIRLECQFAKQKFAMLKYLYQTSNTGTWSSFYQKLSTCHQEQQTQEILSALLLFQDRTRQILIDHSTEVALTLQNNIFNITGDFLMFERKKKKGNKNLN